LRSDGIALIALAVKPNYLGAEANHAISLLLQHHRAPAVAEFQAILQTATAFYEMARFPEASEAFADAKRLRTPAN